MKGLDLAERFYGEEVAPIIKGRFPVLKDRYAAGLIGYGSDVLGHDDEISRDHEWGPRCILWLRGKDYSRYAAFVGEALNDELPDEFLGFPARFKPAAGVGMMPCSRQEGGRPHVDVTTVSEYIYGQFGIRRLPPGRLGWLCIPEQKLLEFTRGKLFRDPDGTITRARQAVAYLPEEIWRFKLLYAWESLHWHLDVVGLCAVRGDRLSAHLALQQIMERIIRLTFLLNRRYCPATLKWISRELHGLPRLAPRIGPLLEKCVGLSDPQKSRPLIEEMIRGLVQEHNRLRITAKVKLVSPDLCSRGQVSFSLRDLVKKLRGSIPSTLRKLRVQGACDQWLTNADVLMEPGAFAGFKTVYPGFPG